MYASLHGLPGAPPISWDGALDLLEVQTVGRSIKDATQHNLRIASENAAAAREAERRARGNR